MTFPSFLRARAAGLAVLASLAAAVQTFGAVSVTPGGGNGSGSGSITNLSPYSAALVSASAATVNLTNSARVYTNYSGQTVTNLPTSITGTNGYVLVTNAGVYSVSLSLTYRSAGSATRTNKFEILTNSVNGSGTSSGIGFYSQSQYASNYHSGAATAQLFLPSNTYVMAGLSQANGAPTNDLVIEAIYLGVTLVPGSTYGGSSGSSGQPPSTGLTNIAAFQAAGQSNRLAVTSPGGYVTNAARLYYVETNQSQLLSNIVAGAVSGDVVRLGAGRFNIGLQSLRVPPGVTLEGAGRQATVIAGTAALTNSHLIVVISSTSVVQNLSIVCANSTVYHQAGLGFYAPNADPAPVGAVVRNVYVQGDSDAVFMSATNFFSVRFFDCLLKSSWDVYIQSYAGAGNASSNYVELWNCTLLADKEGSTYAAGYGANNTTKAAQIAGTARFYNCDLISTNSDTAWGIKLDAYSDVTVVGGTIRVAGTNTVYTVDNINTTWSPTTAPIRVFNTTLTDVYQAPGSVITYPAEQFAALTASGLTVGTDATVGGDLSVTSGTGTFQGAVVNDDLSLAYPTFSKALMIDAAGKVTHVTGTGTYVKADGTTGDPSGSGDVTAASTFPADNQLVRSDGTSKGVQGSGVTLSDGSTMSGVESLSTTNGHHSARGGFHPGTTNILLVTNVVILLTNAPHSITVAPALTATSNTLMMSLGNLPAAGAPDDTWFLTLELTNATTGVYNFPSQIDYRGTTPFVAQAPSTNLYVLRWNGRSLYIYGIQDWTSGTGPLLAATNATSYGATINGATLDNHKQHRTTNYIDGDITINCSTDVSANYTNAVAGNRSITLSTPVIGTSGSLSLTSDGSARTLAILCAQATITWLSTNDTATSTNILTTASKDSLFAWRVRQKHISGSAMITNIQCWVKNQTP
ncbi:MAG TPA: hypothetical protein VFD73_12580 [Gemmatimonadales bacterium]|nr:hypothetical protein [Gemmatimonadales bacterium]